MTNSLRRLTTVVVAALTAALLVAGVATATGQIDIAKKKKKAKPVLTSKQKKAIDKMIAAKIKKINIPAGPAAYSASNGAASGTLPNGATTYTKVLDLAVPAGKYQVSGRANVMFVTTDGSNNVYARCKVTDAAGAVIDDNQGTSGADFAVIFVGAFGYVNLPLSGTVDEAAATTLSISCANANGTAGAVHDSSVGAGQARLTATRVGSIN